MNQVRKDIHSKLISISEDIKNIHISELHDLNLSQRVVKHNLLDFDFSKQRIDDNVLDYLFQIPDQINLRNSLRALFDGEATNPSEERLVSHTLYRNKISVEDFNLIFTERERIKIFLEQEILSSSFKNVICLSIGGSRIGPEFLSEFQSLDGPINIYFCSS